MKRTIYFPEMFELVGEAETKEDKIAVLRRFQDEKGFKELLTLCYEPTINWLVERKDIENLTYDHMDIADYDLAPTTLFLEARRRLFNFTDVRKPPLNKGKVLRLIANMFSVMHHKEIELFKQIVDRNIEETGIDEGLVRDAFPDLLSGEYVPPTPEKKKRGRPPGSKNKPKKKGPGRPKGSKDKTKRKSPGTRKPRAKVKPKAATKVGDSATATVKKAADKTDAKVE